jgi:hypothetical protein
MKSIPLNFLMIFILFVSMSAQTPKANQLVKVHEVTATEMNAISNPEIGSYVYNSTTKAMNYYNGTSWIQGNVDVTTSVGYFTISATGTQTITGLPFEPSSILFSAHANVESTSLNSDNGVANNASTIENAFGTMTGYARNDNGTINQQIIYGGGSGNSINDISRYANNSQCIGIRYSNINGDSFGLTTANLVTFTADGFTINISERIDDVLVMYTAFR